MNIFLTSTGSLEDRSHKHLIKTWRDCHHIVETMPFERVMGYLKVDPGSKWAAVDAIVCKADTDSESGATYTLPRALKLAADFRNLPESCAMRDGRKWKSIPFILISEQPYYFGYPEEITRLRVNLIHPSPYPQELLTKVRDRVDDYIMRVLEDYHDLGLMISFEKDRARIGPALKKKDPEMESAYYYAPADRRNNKRFMTVMRDSDGLRADVELFQQLLDMKAGEREMQRFFEDNPFFLTQARLGVQIPHPSYATKRWSPDFAFTSILGPTDAKDIELLELKGPAEKLLNMHQHHPGFTAKLSNAIDQVRDYGLYLHHPENERKLLRQLGYIPTQSKLAVLIGRDVDREDYMEILERRRRFVPDVEIITYDKILETQAAQMSRIVIPDFDESPLRLGGISSSAFRL
jgi:hypothetical protein